MEQKIVLRNIQKEDYFYDEAIKTLRTNLQFTGKNTKVILFTSCYPNEGKSNIVFDLSVEMGKSGKRVLLLDADIRKSTFARRYGVGREVKGLSQYLSGQVDKTQIVYQTNYANMDFIFAGISAPNSSELLSDPAFGELLLDLRNRYDYVLIDTAPIGTIIDAAVVAEKSDGAVLVIESEAVSRKEEQKIKEQLERSGCTILGAVLNKVDMKKDKYYGRKTGYYKSK